MKEETYRRPAAGHHPPNLSPAYKSTVSRSPSKPAIVLPHTLSEITGPLLREERLDAGENDLTRRRMGEPLGERIIVHGRVLDEEGQNLIDNGMATVDPAGQVESATVKRAKVKP